MIEARANILVLIPRRLQGVRELGRWIGLVNDARIQSDLDPARSAPHSMRKVGVSVAVRYFDDVVCESSSWSERLERYPAVLNGIESILEKDSRWASHVVLLSGSSLDAFATVSSTCNLGGVGGVQFLFLNLTSEAVLSLSNPFGMQVAGRMSAMASSSEIELICSTYGKASADILKRTALTNCALATAIPPFYNYNLRKIVQINEASRMKKPLRLKIVSGESAGSVAARLVEGIIKDKQVGGVGLSIEGRCGDIIRLSSFFEEVLLSGSDLILSPTGTKAEIERLKRVCHGSAVLAAAVTVEELRFASQRLWQATEWRRMATASNWLNDVVRSFHDQLGYNVKSVCVPPVERRVDLV